MRILIAIDSSPFANEIIDEVSGRSWSQDTLFRVIGVVKPTGSWDADQEFIHQARTILNERVKTLSSKLAEHQKVQTDLLEGDSAEMILEEATNWRADLLMLGSHGDTGVRKERLGSVAAAIVNRAPCSVEVVKLHRKSLQLK
ncbi:MAG: universal stress protein [Candidatus Melainabacteria bacterium]|nr:universal stress protein [Candidatus Melainabacteria bacterium]